MCAMFMNNDLAYKGTIIKFRSNFGPIFTFSIILKMSRDPDPEL